MKLLTRLLVFILPFSATAQLQTTMPFMERLHQASYYNPAVIPAYSTSFNVPVLPGIGVDIAMRGITTRKVLNHIDADGLLDLPAIHNEIKGDRVELSTELNLELFHLRFKSRNWYYGINLNQRTITSVSVAKDLLGFVINGNDYFTGRTADFSTTRINAMGFNELGFSMARNYKRWNFGGRAKLLQGNAVVSTSNSTLTVYTPQHTTDEIVLRLNGTVHTAGFPVLIDSINNVPVADSEKEMDAKDFTSSKNLGGAIDLGFTYDVTNRLTVGASVTDLGFIAWRNKTYTYQQNNVEARFGGINDYNGLGNDSLLTALGDSMLALFDGNITREGFSTMLPARFLINASYELNKRNSIGGLVQGRIFNSELIMAYTANYLHKFRNVDVALNYSIIGKSYANIGIGFAAKLGVFQVYVVQDNILSYFAPDRLEVSNLRLGLNFVWGEISKPLKVY